MTDLAQPISNIARPYPVLLAAQGGDLLPLLGNGPFTVDVKVATDGSAEFALPSAPSSTYSDGVNWEPSKPVPSSATITFTFLNGGRPITSLTSNTAGLSFQNKTGSAVATVGNQGPYSFTINTSSGTTNAQIVVTPIGGTGDP